MIKPISLVDDQWKEIDRLRREVDELRMTLRYIAEYVPHEPDTVAYLQWIAQRELDFSKDK